MTDTTETADTAFRGWPADALAFLAELEQDNTRAFWIAHAHRHRTALLEPTRALAAALTAEFGPPRVFRPHVDRRFRPALDPYRTDTGLTVTGPGGTPHALVLSTRGLAVQVGYRLFDAAQLRRFRAAVDGAAGEELVDVLARLQGVDLTPADVAALLDRPRGCPRDHPRLPLLRLRALHVDRAWPAGDWLGTAEPLDRVREAWWAARPLADWLDRHVGPRTESDGTESDGAGSDGAGSDGTGSDGTGPDGTGSDGAGPDTADRGSVHSPSPAGVGSVVPGSRGEGPRPDQEQP